MTALVIPPTMAHLPTTQAGVPVPHVASWSSERWAVARMDPLVENRWALFSEGRQGRGRPLLASINEERQRQSVRLSRCQVCDVQYQPSELYVTTMATHVIEAHGRSLIATYAPPTCEPCLEFSTEACPAFRQRDYEIVKFVKCVQIMQFVDPSAAPMNGADRFDGGDNPETRDRLGRSARKHGGLVGFVKLAIANISA